MTSGSDIDPRALVEMEIKAPVSETPELTQANLIECLRYSAFKLCGKGPQEDYASDAMTMGIERMERAAHRISLLEAALRDWGDKTEWVQKTALPEELGLHRADVLRGRIDRRDAEIERLRSLITVEKAIRYD